MSIKPNIFRGLSRRAALKAGAALLATSATQIGISGGQAAILLDPTSYEPEAESYFDALTTAGAAPSARRKYTLNRAIYRLKRSGIWPKLLGLWCVGDAESAWILDITRRSDLKKIGTPQFFANDCVSTNSAAGYYDTGIAVGSLSKDDIAMGFYALPREKAIDAFRHSDMGVSDGSVLLGMGSTPVAGFRGPAAVYMKQAACFSGFSSDFGNGSNWRGDGFNAISRKASESFSVYRHGLNKGSVQQAALPTNSTATIGILKMIGGTTYSDNRISVAFVGRGLDDAEMCELGAIVRNLDESIRYGEPNIQDAGVGDPIVGADVVVYGVTAAGIIAAYQAKRLGRSVAILGAPREKTVSHLGGMPASGLDWIDTKSPAFVSGLFRTMISWANAKAGIADGQKIRDMSPSAAWWNRTARWMLDPSRSDPLLPGADIPIYFSDGIASIVKIANAIGAEYTELRTADGRLFRPASGRGILIGCDYEGDIIPLLGISHQLGTEPQGSTAGEELNGFQPTAIHLPRDAGGQLHRLDPYVKAGDPASGFLPDIVAMPALKAGSADPILQSMNYRMAVTSAGDKRAPLTGGATLAPPPRYTPLRYEIVGRYLEACSAAGHTPILRDVIGAQKLNDRRSEDWNNGGSFSTDLPLSGQLWLEAGLNLAAREAVIEELRGYTQGFFYWLLQSGDPRIPPSLLETVRGYGLDATTFLDPHPNDPLFWPPQPYRRDPIFQMRNQFSFNGTDTFVTDGTQPRSMKTISFISYRADRHSARRIAYNDGNGTAVYVQGSIVGHEAGGSDQNLPLPLETVVPDKAECSNFISVTAPAMTKIAWYSARMEPTICLAAQAAAIIADQALTARVAVQDIDYSSFRTAFLAVPDSVKPVLQLVN
jgi:hypothetical protein